LDLYNSRHITLPSISEQRAKHMGLGVDPMANNLRIHRVLGNRMCGSQIDIVLLVLETLTIMGSYLINLPQIAMKQLD